MRKLMIFCFTILFAVLSALSCLNFAFSSLDQVEEDTKQESDKNRAVKQVWQPVGEDA